MPDDLTQRIIKHLRKDGRASFTAIARELGTNRDLVASRINPLLASGDLQILAGIHPKVLGKTVSAHLSIRVEGSPEQSINRLVAMDETVFVSETTGAFQLIAELHTESLAVTHQLVSQVRSTKGVVEANVHVYERIISSFFLGPEPSLEGVLLDDTDIAVMKFLQSDGRAALKDVAAHTGLSLGGVRNRINRLLSSGIMNVGALKQRSDMSSDFLFGLGINTKGESEAVEELIKSSSGLEFLARSVGRFDYIATINFATLREFNEFIRKLRSLPTVTYTEQWLHVRIAFERY